MPDTVSATLIPEEMNALANGYHGDPFAVLGMHASDAGVILRTFQPHVKAVAVVAQKDGKTYEMHKIHPNGLYEIVWDRRKSKFDYQLKITDQAGNTRQVADPYAFESTLETDKILYEVLGAHITEIDGVTGTRFAVWAPNAERVSVVGAFNNWDGRRHVMRKHHETGNWEIFIPNVGKGELYKYEIKTYYQGYMTAKSDPMGFFGEMRPNTASVVWDLSEYEWADQAWMDNRAEAQSYEAPMSIYEVHLGSWRRKNGWEWLTYIDMIDQLIPYVKEMGYTHIELLPVSEHPFDGSWGYQVTGYYAPTSRFGTPDEFMAFVDACHQQDIGVILDWVPAHFPKDQHGLSFFDGTHLYEHADPRQGEHPDWGTLIFNFGRQEVREFLICNALFWMDKYHIDGLRVDAVASMLYLDFSREGEEWIPNRYGGRENLEAIDFLRSMNMAVHDNYPSALTIAEESTAWPGVTRPVKDGGLGFDIKWNMGWMNDTLRYMSTDPVYRSYHQGTLTFSLLYAFSEKYVLPFSHDEVVHLKHSILDKMPGDVWQKFANARALYAYQYSHPGRKLNFMGNEIGQWHEWQESNSVQWHWLEFDMKHGGLQKLTRDLNHLYRGERALYEADDNWQGFEWVDFRDALHSILAYLRQTVDKEEQIIVVCNFTPEVHPGYRIGVPQAGTYMELLSTDSVVYGGSGVVNPGPLEAVPISWQDRPFSVQVDLPPLGVIYLKRQT